MINDVNKVELDEKTKKANKNQYVNQTTTSQPM